MVGQVGLEPTMFQTSRIYSPLQSPLCILTHIGGTGWNRTSDAEGFNLSLYQLNYGSLFGVDDGSRTRDRRNHNPLPYRSATSTIIWCGQRDSNPRPTP